MQIVETVTARTMEAMRGARDGARHADIVELRLDSLEPSEVNVHAAIEGRSVPVIVTCRPSWEGGGFLGSEDERLAILARAMELGAEYVDVEWKADRAQLPAESRSALVLSHHDFAGVPSDLADRVAAMRATGAPMIKVAVTATRLSDVLTLREAMRGGDRQVAIAMGPAGVITRLLPHCGSAWTYGGTAAPGQLSVEALRQSFRVDRATPKTRVFGICGKPLGHSVSPAMHNAGFGRAHLDAIYVPFESDDAGEVLRVADALGVEGLSVTAPLKGRMAERCACDDTARAIGAVNTLKRATDGSWLGANFDAAALLDPLDAHDVALDGRSITVLGAGGAARAAAWALTSRGARVTIVARDPERGRRVADACGVDTGEWPPSPGWDVLVNATPVGTAPAMDQSPLARELVITSARRTSHAALRTPHPAPGPVVYDLVYNPRETTLVRFAREAGAVGIGGLDMLVSQAVRQFEWWTGVSVDRGVMVAAATQALDRMQ